MLPGLQGESLVVQSKLTLTQEGRSHTVTHVIWYKLLNHSVKVRERCWLKCWEEVNVSLTLIVLRPQHSPDLNQLLQAAVMKPINHALVVRSGYCQRKQLLDECFPHMFSMNSI